MTWSKDFKSCKSCDTTIFEHKGKGLCSRCYSANKEIEKLNSSHGQNLELFIYKYIPVRDIVSLKSKSVVTQKKIIKKNIEYRRLRYLKFYGLIRKNSLTLDILQLENIFNDVAWRVTKQERFFTNGLSSFFTRFTKEQRKIIALKLLLMIINKRK